MHLQLRALEKMEFEKRLARVERLLRASSNTPTVLRSVLAIFSKEAMN